MALRQIILFFFITLATTFASDPDIISDFIVPQNCTTLDGNCFTFTGLRNAFDIYPPKAFSVKKVSLSEFPILNGQSVSFAVLQFPAGSINPPHTHPRASELLYLIDGTLEVGFVDTKNVLFKQTLKAGDMFVFPKGLAHFQYNRNHENPAAALSAFGSASAGTVSIPISVFGTGIDDVILAKSFKTNVDIIMKIKKAITIP